MFENVSCEKKSFAFFQYDILRDSDEDGRHEKESYHVGQDEDGEQGRDDHYHDEEDGDSEEEDDDGQSAEESNDSENSFEVISATELDEE